MGTDKPNFKPTKEQRQIVVAWLIPDSDWDGKYTRGQYWESHQSWNKGHNVYPQWSLGGTCTMRAIMWYQHTFKPGSKEWRPSIIMRAVLEEATKQKASLNREQVIL